MRWIVCDSCGGLFGRPELETAFPTICPLCGTGGFLRGAGQPYKPIHLQICPESRIIVGPNREILLEVRKLLEAVGVSTSLPYPVIRGAAVSFISPC